MLTSGNTGRVDFEESCEVVDYQLKSGLEVRGQQNKNARMSVSEVRNCSKRTFQGQHHFSDHTKGYAGDSGGIVVTYEDTKERLPKIWMKLPGDHISSHVQFQH